MRAFFTIIACLLLLTLPVRAQVTVNPGALDALGPKPAAPAAPAAKPAPKPAAKPATPAPATPAAPALPALAPAPPPNVALPPPIAVPTRPAPPPQPAPISADAASRTERLNAGLRVIFGTGRSDITPDTDAAIRALVKGGPGTAPAAPNAAFTVTSFAAGDAQDPSTPRRLSLSRALAVRSVLMGQGIASTRIYVRALGPSSPGYGDGPSDRADIVVGPNPVPPPPATSASPPPAAPK